MTIRLAVNVITRLTRLFPSSLDPFNLPINGAVDHRFSDSRLVHVIHLDRLDEPVTVVCLEAREANR